MKDRAATALVDLDDDLAELLAILQQLMGLARFRQRQDPIQDGLQLPLADELGDPKRPGLASSRRAEDLEIPEKDVAEVGLGKVA